MVIVEEGRVEYTLYNADSQGHTRSHQNHRECGLEICRFSKQGILMLLKLSESLISGKSLRDKLS